jgi:zinc/manganese transport system substrate-binding protein
VSGGATTVRELEVKVLVRLRFTMSILAAATAMMAGCGPGVGLQHTGHGPISAIGAENEYADVISQIGGRYVSVAAVESNPNVDPHSFEASPSVARAVSSARLVVQNGLGYDTFMKRIESASPSSSRRVIDVQKLLGLPDSTRNPHLWYMPRTMPAVARAIAADLSAIAPAHAAYFAANEQRFDASLRPWGRALAQFAARYPHVLLAVTEPVGNYMLQAARASILTPFELQADIMNGVDPAPQDVALEKNLLSRHRVKVLLYNQQVTDSLTQSFMSAARSDGIPVVGVYETMPEPGYDYQSWMVAEVRALTRAVAERLSTERLR